MYKTSDGNFDWDIDKNFINIQKHGISFEEAASVFSDTNALYFDDHTHSSLDDRFIVIGRSKKYNLLMVCHCYRNGDTIIRLISARKANHMETTIYDEEAHYE